jgi:hypothetical protein
MSPKRLCDAWKTESQNQKSDSNKEEYWNDRVIDREINRRLQRLLSLVREEEEEEERKKERKKYYYVDSEHIYQFYSNRYYF